jgi:hypothetical protein
MKTLMLFLFGWLSLSTAASAAIIPESDIIWYLKHELNFPKPALALAIIRVESSVESQAKVYDSGCRCHTYGLMQIQLATARSEGYRGSPHQLLNWKTNLTYGSRYLLSKIEEYRDIPTAISAYNAGTALVRRTRIRSLRRFQNFKYVKAVMDELADIQSDKELMQLIKSRDFPPATS